MIATGSYFALILFCVKAICAIPQFSHSDIYEFCKYILQKHNEYRKTHHSEDLEVSRFANTMAEKYMYNWIDEVIDITKICSINIFSMTLDDNSKLDAELATKIVADWYKTGEDYNYDIEPRSKPNEAGPFIRIVWKYATQIGFRLKVENEILYLVVYYHYIDENEANYKENVFKPNDDVHENQIIE